MDKKTIIFLIVLLLNGASGSWGLGTRGTQPGDETAGCAAFYGGDYKTAEQEYRKLRQQYPKEIAWARDLAAVLLAEEQYAEAAQVLEKAGVTGVELGEASMAAGDLTGALAMFKRSLLPPGPHTAAWTLLGLLSTLQGSYAEAVQYYWHALEENPKQPSVHLWLARTFNKMGMEPSAEHAYFEQRAGQEYQAALKVDASLWQVYRDLALLAEHEEKWGEALRCWQRVESVIGDTQEVVSACKRVKKQGPAPTVTPTAVAMALVPVPVLPGFPQNVLQPLGHPGDPTLDVGLANNLPSLAFGCEGEWRARDQNQHPFWKGREKTGYRLEQNPSGGWILKSWDRKLLKTFQRPLIIESLDPKKPLVIFNLYQTDGYLWSGGGRGTHAYRGQIRIVTEKKKLQLINRILAEDYLASVVPGEMEASWPSEALKAQAVVARTAAWGRLGLHHQQGYDVCSSVHCAYYRGVEAEDSRTYAAILSTSGEVLRKEQKLIPAYYTHACGGLLQSPQEAWSNRTPDPLNPGGIYDAEGTSLAPKAFPIRPGALGAWLAGSPGVFCRNTLYSGEHSFRWFKILTQEELSDLLDRRYQLGKIQRLQILERSPSAYVRKILIEGEQKKVMIQGDAIRSSLGGLRSNLFMLLPIPAFSSTDARPQAWLIWGGGWGHGVGFCQAGAAEMGRQGYSYKAILRHYFPQADLPEEE